MNIKKVLKYITAGLGLVSLFFVFFVNNEIVKPMFFVGAIFFSLIPHFISESSEEKIERPLMMKNDYSGRYNKKKEYDPRDMPPMPPPRFQHKKPVKSFYEMDEREQEEEQDPVPDLEDEPVFSCGMCKQQFTRKDALIRHMTREH